MSERFARNSRGRVPPRSGWRVRSASSPRSCAYRGCRCCPGSSPAAPTPLLIIRRVPGSLCSRSSTRSTGIVQADGSGSSWRHCTSRQPRTCRGAVGKLTGTQCRRPRPDTLRDRFGSWVRPDQRRASRAGASGRRRAGLCPTETLRPPLPGSKPRPCSGPAPPSRAGPDTAPASYRSGARASACSRRCVPARLGHA